jgi:polyferredoxin
MNEINQTSKNRPNHNIQAYRKIVQYLFLAVTFLIGVQFSIFVGQLEKGVLPTMTRPPGIEAFLPISSLISFKYWLLTGVFNPIHPSGLIIFLVILSTAILLKRGFCSWVCPFGLLTEYLNRLHRFIFRKDIKVPRWLDYPLRSLKYLLLLFFLWAIIIQMNIRDLDHFIYSPYNMVADIKMLHFFTNISAFAFWVLAALLVFSQLLVPLSVPLRCPSGRTQLCQHF